MSHSEPPKDEQANQDKSNQDKHETPLERLRDSFHEEVDKLRELELDVEEFAHRKTDLLKEYLKDDVHGAQDFWRELKGEGHMLEKFVADWLLSAADPSRLDWAKLNQYLNPDQPRIMAGELVTDAELVCAHCGNLRLIEGTKKLEACSGCGCELYEVR